MKTYYVYILANKKNGTLYIGVTNNIERRLLEHKHGVTPGFTSKYGVNKLVYYELFLDIDSAIRHEKRLKKWKRDWKIQKINDFNPDWKDLAAYLLESVNVGKSKEDYYENGLPGQQTVS
ncbi:MAG: GIY-YIG nuclease family protein [Fibrobacteria bacterium]|nr:GIY-YIG nuclease family protein [Fibrobacteria bacterium]